MDILWSGPSDIDRNKALAEWASSIVAPTREIDLTPCTCMAVIDRGLLIAVMIWNNWDQHAGTMELSGAAVSKRWLTKPVLNSMFFYPFQEANCQMVVARVSEHNTPLLRQLKSIGFDQITVPRLRGRNEAAVVCTMTDEQWQASKFYREVSHA